MTLHIMIGEVLSHYQIVSEAGSGAMGRVYEARDRRLNRSVALKVLHADEVTGSRRRRFVREAQAASRLSHPGLVAIYDVGSQNGCDFIVMEWVRGRTLRERMDEGPLTLSEALDCCRQLADAVAAAHAAGIIHRDLKPRNVMVDDAGRLKVLDFGIAKADPILEAGTLSTDPSTLTEEGATPGTLAYMSPEQSLGEALDARSDIFSFGVVAYEMLTGVRPFQGLHVAVLVQRLVFQDPEPPSRFRPEIPPELDALVLKALAKHPEDRHPDMTDLSAELAAVQVPTISHPASRGLEPAPRLVPRLMAWLAGITLVLTLGLGTVATGVLPIPGNAGRDGSQPLEGASSSPTLPPSPYELYQQGLLLLERYDRAGYIDRAIQRFRDAIRADEEYAPAHSGLARAYWRQYRLQRDPVWLHKARDSAHHAFELDPHLSHARISLARIRIERGELEAARRELERLRGLDPANAEIPAALADVATREGELQEAISLLTEALGLDPGDWELHAELGIAQRNAGNLAAAEDAFLRSVEQVPDNAFAYRNLGGIYFHQERYEEAISSLQRSLGIRPTAVGYSNLGTVYFFRGFYRDAAAAFEAAAELGANTYQIWANLGDAYRQIPGKREEAATSFRRAIQLLRQELETRPEDAEARSRMALYLARLGHVEQALAEIARLETSPRPSAPTLYRTAVTYELAGERDRALEALGLALNEGYSLEEILHEPDLIGLRQSIGFHRLAVRFAEELPS